jgi:hypothetical protein
MIKFTAILEKLSTNDHKNGWIVVPISKKIAQQLKPNNKKALKVLGKIDEHEISGLALLPMGNGDFIMPIKLSIRKAIKKIQGAKVTLQLQEDKTPLQVNTDLIDCLQDEPTALDFFNSLAPSHKRYFSNWVNDAKTETTKAKRIATCINALAKKWDYVLMIRTSAAERKKLSN